MILLTTTKI